MDTHGLSVKKPLWAKDREKKMQQADEETKRERERETERVESE